MTLIVLNLVDGFLILFEHSRVSKYAVCVSSSYGCNCVGDMETGQLVQEISNLVDILPQLKVTFNLQAEIDLAMQPLRNENSQLRR